MEEIIEAGGAIYSLLLEGLLCGLGLGPRHLLGGGGLDHTHRHRLPHVSDCEPNNLTYLKFLAACLSVRDQFEI